MFRTPVYLTLTRGSRVAGSAGLRADIDSRKSPEKQDPKLKLDTDKIVLEEL